MVQLRLWRRPLLPAGHVGIGAAATVGEAPSDAGEDGECERGQGDLRAAGGGGAQHRRTQALQPAQRQGNRPTLPGIKLNLSPLLFAKQQHFQLD